MPDFADEPRAVQDADPAGTRLIGIRLRPGARADDYLLEAGVLHVGALCVVEVPSGHAVGEVRRPARPVPEFRRDRTYPRVLRAATPEEAHAYRARQEREQAGV